jgi:hypothetical protein
MLEAGAVETVRGRQVVMQHVHPLSEVKAVA